MLILQRNRSGSHLFFPLALLEMAICKRIRRADDVDIRIAINSGGLNGHLDARRDADGFIPNLRAREDEDFLFQLLHVCAV